MKLLKIGLVLAALGLIAGLYLYNKPHQNMMSATTDISMDATQLFEAFEANENVSNEKYLDKIIEVKGKVREVKKDETGNLSVILETDDMMFGVVCQLDELSTPKRTAFQPGEEVTFKGVCTGVLMDVVLVRCVEL